MRKLLAAAALSFAALFAIAPSVAAMQVQSGQHLSLPTASSSGSTYAAGNSIVISSEMDGDLICGTQTLTVNAPVHGDIICGAQSININAPVDGSLRLAGQTILLNSTVGRNVTLLGQTIDIASSAKISGDAFVFGSSVDMAGSVAGGMTAGGQDTIISGSVGGNTSLYGEKIDVQKGATIGGSLSYTSSQDATINGSVAAPVTHHQPPSREHASSKGLDIGAWFGLRVATILAFLVLALSAVWLFPTLTARTTSTMALRPGATIGFGLLAVFLVPIVLVLLLITLVGLPLAAIGGLLWIVALLISRVLAAIAIGRFLLSLMSSKPAAGERLVASALIGVPVAWIFFGLPQIGWFFSMIALVWGIGGIILSAWHHNRPQRKATLVEA